MLNVEKLLHQKTYTGKLLGQLEMVNALHIQAEGQRGVEDPKPLVEEAQFQQMLRTIWSRDEELRVYRGYLAIHEWFSVAYAMAEGQQQQAFLNLNGLSNGLVMASVGETLAEQVSALPVLMTKQQYAAAQVQKSTTAARPVAVLQEDAQQDADATEASLSGMKQIEGVLNVVSLRGFFPEVDPSNAQNKRNLHLHYRELLESSYYFLLGYNTALSLIAKMFDLEEMESAKISLEHFQLRVQDFNQMREMMVSHLQRTSDADRQKKLAVMEEVFSPIDLETLQVPEAAIQKAREDMKDFKAFRNYLLDIKLTLCYRKTTSEEELS